MKKDLVFVCKKCEHNLFITNGVEMTGKQLARKLKVNCPSCGEEPDDQWVGLWIFTRKGDYKKEYE